MEAYIFTIIIIIITIIIIIIIIIIITIIYLLLLMLLLYYCYYLFIFIVIFFSLRIQPKTLWSNIFWYVKLCIFWKCFPYIIHWGKTQMLKKIPSDKISSTKNVYFFFRELQFITVLLLIYNFYMSRNTSSASLNLCLAFSDFDSVLFWLKFIFLLKKTHELLDFKAS